MITDTLSAYPGIGIASTVGTALVHYLEIINPVLSMISLLIGILLGITTLYLQIRKILK